MSKGHRVHRPCQLFVIIPTAVVKMETALHIMNRRFLTVPSVLASFALFAACHEDPDPPETPSPAAQLRDSAGILITENQPPPEGSSLGWEIGPEPTVTIGAAEGEAPYLLHSVRRAATLSDGRIVVADGASDEVRVFDPDGVHLVSWGGEGEGPGRVRCPERRGPLAGRLGCRMELLHRPWPFHLRQRGQPEPEDLSRIRAQLYADRGAEGGGGRSRLLDPTRSRTRDTLCPQSLRHHGRRRWNHRFTGNPPCIGAFQIRIRWTRAAGQRRVLAVRGHGGLGRPGRGQPES